MTSFVSGHVITSRECLELALECARLSQKATDITVRETLAAMAKTWVKLADTERARALVDGWDDPERETKVA